MKAIFLFLIVIAFVPAFGDVVTLYPDKDARLVHHTNPAYTHYQNTNFGDKTVFDAIAGTSSGYLYKTRSLMGFNLNEIPAGSVITSATL